MSDTSSSTALTAYSWQMAQWQQLSQLAATGRLPHALLFSGPDGIGKQRFALSLAASLLCEAASEFSACGQCKACQMFSAGSHPDFREICPDEGKRQIGIDQIRDLQGYVGRHAHRNGGRKLILVHPAEAMNQYTANALLKTLEEPAGDTVILLVSHAPSHLLATIRSRCLQMKFGVPSRSTSLSWLQNHVGDAEQSALLLSEAGGRPLAARQLFDNDGLRRWQRYDARFAELAAGRLSALVLAEELAGEDVVDGLDWWLCRTMGLSRATLAKASPPPGVWPQFGDRQPTWLMQQIDKVVQLRAKIVRGAALNKRLLWEDILLSWVG